jgi:hypothetical protein
MPTIQWMSFTTSRLCSTTIIVLPLVDKLMQYVEKLRGVLEMEPGHLERPSESARNFRQIVPCSARKAPVIGKKSPCSRKNRPVTFSA